MKHFVRTVIKRAFFIVALSAFIMTLSTQESSGQAYEEAKKEITETFGTFLSMFDAFPEYALPGAWQAFKELTGPQGSIDPKNRELIGLAVASQIPCSYCVYFHTVSAKAYGATDEELKEAVAFAGSIRNWSTVIHGNQIELDDFKKEFDEMMKYMAEQANAK